MRTSASALDWPYTLRRISRIRSFVGLSVVAVENIVRADEQQPATDFFAASATFTAPCAFTANARSGLVSQPSTSV